MENVWINMTKDEAYHYLTVVPDITPPRLDPETDIEAGETGISSGPGMADIPAMPDINMTILYDQDGRDWKAMQQLLRITGWVGLSKRGSQIGFGITSRRGSWYIECIDYKMVDRPSMGKGVTLEEAILAFVELNPELVAKWNV